MRQRTESVIWKMGYKKNTQAEQQKEKKKRIFKNEESLRNILDNMKQNNVHIIGIPEGEDSEQGSRTYLKKY